MPSFGEKLKQERLKRSITLEQISISTKIGTRMLQALEEDKFNQLPGGIFNKGFVRSYARFVGLDEEQAVTDYLEASGEGAPKAPQNNEPILNPPPKPPEPSASRPLPWGLFAGLLLVVALSLAVWTRRQHRELSAPTPAPATERVASQPPSTAVANEPATPPAVAPQPAPIHPTKSEPSPKPVSRPPTATLAANAAPQPAASSLAAPEEFSVIVHAREDSWLSISADGNSLFADTIVGGNQRSIQAKKEVVIRAGNVGALDFVFNGKKLPAQGDFGEVRTLTFGPGGLVRAGPPPASPQ